jgi:hypothetical protein
VGPDNQGQATRRRCRWRSPFRPWRDGRRIDAWTLAEDLILLSIREQGFLPSGIDYALAGSEMLRLVFRGRVDLTTGRMHVLDSNRIGDESLDPARVTQAVISARPTE